jgi:non-specific serine/threonine protein kinase
VQQIAARLDNRLRLLAGGGRTAPSRQRTLRATLDWSFGLLEDAERQLLSRLSVFAASWSLEAAEAICGGDGVEPGAVLDLLGRLVDQSLVVAEQRGSQGRYRFLETVRQYAAEKLAESGQSAILSSRHRDWFLAQAERSPLELSDPDHVAWLADELDNLRSAMQWSLEYNDVECALRLAIAVAAFWHQRGAYAEGRGWFATLLARPTDSVSRATRAKALARAAILAMLQSDLMPAQSLVDESVAIAHDIGDSLVLSFCHCVRGLIAWRQGVLEQAQADFEQGRLVSNEYGHPGMEFYAVLNLGMVALDREDASAEQLGLAALALADRIGHVRGRPSALYVLGRVAASHGRVVEARALLEEALVLNRQNIDRDGTEVTLRGFAELLLDQGEIPEARALLAESLALAQEGGDRLEVARALESLVGTAITADPRYAVRMAAAAAALRETLRAVPYPHDRARLVNWLDIARRRLGQSAYDIAWNQGYGLTLEQAVQLGLEVENGQRRLSSIPPLSLREQQVAQLVARGSTNREIAEQLVIAPRTADTHVGNILAKLNLHSRAELAAWVVAHGLTVSR